MRTEQTEERRLKQQRLELRTELERKCDAKPILPAHGRHMLEPPRT
jgi:cell division septum initiation protein DivIVA